MLEGMHLNVRSLVASRRSFSIPGLTQIYEDEASMFHLFRIV